MNRRTSPASWPELEELHAWMRTAQGGLTPKALAAQTVEAEYGVSDRTLRRAFDGRLPTASTIRGYAWAWASRTCADRQAVEARGLEILGQALRAAPPAPAPRWPQPSYVPGRISTWGGLNKALKHIHEETGSPSRRALAASERAAGRLSKSTIGNILNGKEPTVEQLAALLAAYGARPKTTAGILAGHERIVGEPPVRAAGINRCDDIEHAVVERETAGEQAEKQLRYRGRVPAAELDAYDQQRRDEEDAEHRRTVAWVDNLSDDEFEAIKARSEQAAATAVYLRAELTAIAHRACPGP
ncbi:hypothetical protein ACIQU4_27105 [Streptomyces sp. NPDC090741]|uniref:hypothetical protein n=1 Tax=Streptomyces sp. NPDC090741 TaxID=3365967 RepID=UPI0038230745